MRRLGYAVLVALLLCWTAWAGLEARFDGTGLAGLALDGQDRLAQGTPAIWRAVGADGGTLSTKVDSSTFDAETRTFAVTYAWGTLSYVYEPEEQALRVRIAVANTGPAEITELGVAMLSLRCGVGTQRIDRATHGVEGPPWVTADCPAGSVVWASEGEERPLFLTLQPGTDPKTKAPALQARVQLGGDRIVVDNVTAARPIAAGATERFSMVVRLGAAGHPALDLAVPEIAAYRAKFPPLLDWQDRRPILRLFFGGGLPKEQALENLKNPDAVVPPEPDPKFRERVLARMRSCVEGAKRVDAQGVVLWDLEGETFPHAVTFIGDPRHIRLLNPQMDLAIDEGVAVLKEAGLLVGVTLRPSRVVFNAERGGAVHSHTDAKDPYEELAAKVEYIRKRWGCTLVYIDTNFFWRPYGKDAKWQSAHIAPEVWRRLLAKYPDTLFIPEIPTTADYQATAPYGEADMGNWNTPGLVRRIWPESFRVIVLEDADPVPNFDRFVACLRDRNVLMTYAYSPATHYMNGLANIQEVAKFLEAGVPASVAAAEPSALVGFLSDADPAVRYHAVVRLRAKGIPESAKPLWERAQDTNEVWGIRRESLLALAKTPDPATVSALIDWVGKREQGLYHAAAEALVAVGKPAVVPLCGRIETVALAPKANAWAIDSWGDVLVRLGAGDDAAPGLLALLDRLPEGRDGTNARKSLIGLLGRLRHGPAEPRLVAWLSDPELAGVSAEALIRTGTDTAMQSVSKRRDEAKAAKEDAFVDRIDRVLREK